jgi:hypothetical protein
MTSLKSFVPGRPFGGTFNALLTKPDGFDLVAYFGYNNMGFSGVFGGGFWFVKSAYPSSFQPWVLLRCHYFFFLDF